MVNLRIHDKYKNILVGLSITVAACLIAFALSQFEIVKRVELITLDLRFRWQPDVKFGPSDIALIAVSEETLQDERFDKSKDKLSRKYYFDVVDKLLENNAKLVVFDLLFEDRLDKIGDDLLVDVTEQYSQRIVHAMGVKSLTFARNALYSSDVSYKSSDYDVNLVNQDSISATSISEESSMSRDVLPKFAVEAKVDGKDNLYQAADLSLPWPELMEASSSIGHIMTIPDIDGYIRKVPLIIEYKNGYYPSLSLIAACKLLGVSDKPVRIQPGRWITLEDSHHRVIRIPIDKKARVTVKYPESITTFTRYSFKDIYDYESKKEQGIPVSPIFDNLKDKVILIYSSTTEPALTPVSNKFPGVGIHASILQSILSGKFIKEGASLSVVLMFFIASSIVAMQLFWTPRKASIVASGILVVFLVGAWGLFVKPGIALNMTQIILAMFLCYVAAGYYHRATDLRRTNINLQKANDKLNQAYQDLLEARQREMTLEGISGLALEIVSASHGLSKRTGMPFSYRIWLLSRVTGDLLNHIMSLGTSESYSLIHVIREAFKLSCRNQLEVSIEDNQIDAAVENGINIEGITCKIVQNSETIDVMKPYILQFVLTFIIENALKLDVNAHFLKITAEGSSNEYTIAVEDDGEDFPEELVTLIQQPPQKILEEMNARLEEVERIRLEEGSLEAEEYFQELGASLGVGLLLSQLIVRNLYNGDIKISRKEETGKKTITVLCRRQSNVEFLFEKGEHDG